jgi:hypothetical protein
MPRYNLRKMMNYTQTIEKIKNETIFWIKIRWDKPENKFKIKLYVKSK